MSAPRRTLKTAHDVQNRVRPRGEEGRWIQLRRSGIAGRRNRGSWWGIRLRNKVPVRADWRRASERVWRVGWLENGRKRRMRAGPRSWGMLIRKC